MWLKEQMCLYEGEGEVRCNGSIWWRGRERQWAEVNAVGTWCDVLGSPGWVLAPPFSPLYQLVVVVRQVVLTVGSLSRMRDQPETSPWFR